MSDAEKKWREMRDEYLRQIEAELTAVRHPRKKELLSDVRDHLERRFEELDPSQRMDRRFEQILEEMGPAEEYAELLKQPSAKKTEAESASPAFQFLNHLLTGVFVIVLFSVVGYKLYTADIKPKPDPMQDFILKFQPDPQVMGRWVTVDFVESIEQFVPGQRQCRRDFFLTDLEFYKDMKTSKSWLWSKGKFFDPTDQKQGEYQIRTIEGNEYLFWEWLPDRDPQAGRCPYYVLEKETIK
jgi:hypothetical protein